MRDEGNGAAEMVRILCADTAEPDRIAAELDRAVKRASPQIGL